MKIHEDGEFVHLAPSTEIENGASYKRAFEYSVGNKSIRNIGVTGPYGAGKSSVIQSLKGTMREQGAKILEISLASFEVEEDSVEQEQLEFSILQQLQYSTSSETLPQSRFKRIKTPHDPIEISTFFTLWIFGLLGLNIYWPKYGKMPWPSIEHLLALVCFMISLLGVFYLIKWFYETSANASFKKISLKLAEIEKEEGDTSVLNKNIDEILYFFERTSTTVHKSDQICVEFDQA